MKFKGLDGVVRSIDPWQYTTKSRKSIGQRTMCDIITSIIPYRCVEEMPCPGTNNLRLDVFVPALRLAFEFDGRQHSEYVARFHGDRAGYARSVANDQAKSEWCEVNDIRLIRVTEEDLSEDRIREIISEGTGSV